MSLFPSQQVADNFWSVSPLLSSTRWCGVGLTPSERQETATQLISVLRDYYVHLPLKVSALGINPGTRGGATIG